jgi:DNA-binding transcriptional regulator YiaG
VKPASIRSARKRAGLTQSASAALIGAALRTWQDWEGGKRNMPKAKWDLWKLRAELARIVDGRK